MSEKELHKSKVEVFRLLNGRPVRDCLQILKSAIKEYKEFALSNVLDVSNKEYDDWAENEYIKS